MSSQSGISVNQDVLDAFKRFSESTSRFLLVRIVGETIQAETPIDGSNSLASDFDSLHLKLGDAEPVFIIARKDEDKTVFVFVSYVPDSAKVHDKMVYASTKNTVLRSLGSEHFQPVIFVNDSDELSAKGWAQFEISEKSSEKPLTEAEKTLEKVKANELFFGVETQKRGLARDEARQVRFELEPELEKVLNGDNSLDGKLVTIVIDGEKLTLKGERKMIDPKKELVGSLSKDSPSYNLLGYKGDYFFIYCCPSGSKVRDRMKYATNRLAFTKDLEKKGYELKDAIEVGDPEEIEVGRFDGEEEVVKEQKNLRFTKPKGPRRR